MSRGTLAVALIGAVVLGACGPGDEGADGRLEVVASFYPLAEMAGAVGGDRVVVRNLTPAGAEPHDVELSPRQVDQMDRADVVFYVGRGFQPAVETLAERRDGGTVDLLEGLTLERDADDEVDPHFWLDPQRMAAAVDEVADALVEASPDDAAAFRAGGARYRQQLDELDTTLEQGLASCARRQIVTSHAAVFYLADRYDLTQLAVSGLSPEAEPDPERLSSLADTIEAKGITTVFFEELVSPDVARALARETGAETAVLNPIEGLTTEQQDEGETYITVMGENLAALRRALACR